MSILSTLKNLFAKPYTNLDATAAAALMDEGAVLLDVRETPEWRAGHAPRARHIPLGQLSVRMNELPTARPVITVCRSGMRSAQAASVLARQGWQVHNLSGGMNAWVRAGLPVVANGGRAGAIV